jgi:hypothetical protein
MSSAPKRRFAFWGRIGYAKNLACHLSGNLKRGQHHPFRYDGALIGAGNSGIVDAPYLL